jgi:DNA polymerase-3 subunit chi
MVEGAETDRMADFDRVFDLFDGNSPDAVVAARVRWKLAREAGHILHYWQQTETSWHKKE